MLDEAAGIGDKMKREAKSIIDSATSGPMLLSTLEKETLMHIVTDLGGRYKAADAERLELKRLVAEAQSTRRQFGELLTQYQELENAHMIQSKLLQKAQKKQTKAEAHAETIKTQEQVIAKMETFIESRLRQQWYLRRK